MASQEYSVARNVDDPEIRYPLIVLVILCIVAWFVVAALLVFGGALLMLILGMAKLLFVSILKMFVS